MQNRTCPNCKNDLSLSDCYFCSACGMPLESANIQTPSVFYKRIVEKSFEVEIKLKHFADVLRSVSRIANFKEIALILGLLTAVAGTFTVWTQVFSKMTKMPDKSVSSGNTAPIRQDPIYEFVPYEADMVIKASDFSGLQSVVGTLSVEHSKAIEKLQKSGNKAAVLFITTDSGATNITIIFSSPSDLTPEVRSGFLTENKLYAEKLEDMFVVSEGTQSLKNSIDSRVKIAKSLAVNPKFVVSSSNYGQKNPGRFEIAILTDLGKKHADKFSGLALDQELGNALKKMVKENLVYFVVN